MKGIWKKGAVRDSASNVNNTAAVAAPFFQIPFILSS